jgi:aspartyl-tRNA(Asn)/glutamyl-tRNA(Gln) amidotransferase subunit C
MPDTKINRDDLLHIAKLSRLTIPSEEENELIDQLSQTVSYIDVLTKLDTQNVAPTFQVNHKKNVFRSDEIKPSLTQQQALSNAKDAYQGYFKTEATINKNK